jgi:ribonuclease PH
MLRSGGRRIDELRPVVLEPDYMPYAEGSCLVQTGDTRVVCTATIERGVPVWLRGRGLGWLEAEYGMLPRCSPQQIQREVSKGRPASRTVEIQRLIGRSLRAAVDLGGFGERTIVIDCDVLQADGGTRTASVTGSFVALARALGHVERAGVIDSSPLIHSVAAVSVGIVDGEPRLDLDNAEDRAASVDMNVVMTGEGDFVEIQGTAEHGPFDHPATEALLKLARKGIGELLEHQRAALTHVTEKDGAEA